MKFEIQRNSCGFTLICIAYIRNVHMELYYHIFDIWLFNRGFVWKWN